MLRPEPGFDYDVVQIGYGPVSKAAALMLERLGWTVGVFERFAEIYPMPRAVCIDHEIYRVLHASGLGDLVRSVTEPAPMYRWYNADWKELLCIDWTRGSVSGGTEVNFVHQPSFERALDAEAKKRPRVALQFGCEAIDLAQDDGGVTVTVRTAATGELRTVRARYVIGIDGANSFVCNKLGIGRVDKGFEADWLVIDFVLKDGLTAKDLGIPECGQYCNPVRPTTIVPGGNENGRVCRRWEFMRLPHETREEMEREDKVWELLKGWIEPDQGELVRHTVYTFRSLIAERWREGRIFLAGDAAHVMPPFMGQGMCAGLRDVWNLSWKLDAVMRGQADASLLETYGPERRPHVADVIDASIFLGKIICIPDLDAAARRDHDFLTGAVPPPPPFPFLTDGLIERDADGRPIAPAGRLSPHGTVRLNGRTGRYDSFVEPGFTLILTNGLHKDDLDEASRDILDRLGARIVEIKARKLAREDDMADTQSQFLPQMADFGVQALLVRPDFYIFGGADGRERLNAMIADLGRQTNRYDVRLGGGRTREAAE